MPLRLPACCWLTPFIPSKYLGIVSTLALCAWSGSRQRQPTSRAQMCWCAGLSEHGSLGGLTQLYSHLRTMLFMTGWMRSVCCSGRCSAKAAHPQPHLQGLPQAATVCMSCPRRAQSTTSSLLSMWCSCTLIYLSVSAHQQERMQHSAQTTDKGAGCKGGSHSQRW